MTTQPCRGGGREVAAVNGEWKVGGDGCEAIRHCTASGIFGWAA
jgi:hypothetical protein